MDRRKLIVGGGAAAVATTLTAVTGAGMPAAASGISAGQTSTEDHARRVLDQVDEDLGLVNPAGLQRQFDTSYADFLASDPRDPNADDLDAWIRRRLLDLCGTDSLVAAVTEIPQTRLLVAFSFLAYSQNQDIPLPRLQQGMRAPTLLRTLEPDFLPVLLNQIQDKTNTSRAFASALQAASAEVDRIIAEKLRSYPFKGARAQMSPRNGEEAVAYIVGVAGFIAFLYWIKGGLK